MIKNKGILIVFTGCSGVGKGTILKEVLKRDKNNMLSVSATTRSPRPGEENGREYFFLNKDEFEAKIKNDEFLEYACYCGNYYGTPKKAVDDMIAEGKNVVLEIEVQGGENIMKKCPDCVSVFILPPSVEELSNRLHGRGTEDEETISKRLAAANGELEYAKYYKYNVINDNLEDAIEKVMEIIEKERKNIN